MKKTLYIFCYFISCLAFLAKGQAVFTENFNRTTFGTSGGVPTVNYTLSSGTRVDILGSSIGYFSSTSIGNVNYFTAPLASYAAPFNTTLSRNQSVLTWVFNMRMSHRTTSPLSSSQLSGGVDLCSTSGTNIFNGIVGGYAVTFSHLSTGGLQLIKFNNGMSVATPIIVPTSSMPFTNFYSVRVTYNPQNSLWSLYLRDDGTSAFANPNTGVTTLVGSVVDNTFTNLAMSNFGFAFGYNAGLGKNMFFDNFKVSIGPIFNVSYLPVLVCSNNTQVVTSTITNTYASGENLPRIYFRKNRSAWRNTQGTCTAGINYRFSMDTALLGGVTAGDTIFYYLVAKDTNSYSNVVSSSARGFVSNSLTAITTHPTNPNFYIVGVAPYGGAATSSSTTPCLGTPLTLHTIPTNLTTYSWLGPDGFTATTSSFTRTATTGASGVYTLSAVNACGSIVVVSPTISVRAAPSIHLAPDSQAVCPGSIAALEATGGIAYSWSPASSLSSSTGSRVATTALSERTIYTVTGTDGTCNASATAIVQPLVSPNFVQTSAQAPTICSGGVTLLRAKVFSSDYDRVDSMPYAHMSSTTPVFIRDADWVGTDDEGTVTVSLPFTFNFYGNAYNTLYIATNGYVSFINASTSFEVNPMPSSTVPKAVIALFLSDLVCPDRSVSYSVEGIAPHRMFIINYDDVTPYYGSGALSGQIILYEQTNVIDLNVARCGRESHLCGVQNSSRTRAICPVGRNADIYEVTTPESWRINCHPTSLRYNWMPSATLSSTSLANTVSSGLTATTLFTVTATDTVYGCSSQNVVAVNIGALSATISGTTSVCYGNSASITITGTPNDTVEYTINDGLTQEIVLNSFGMATLVTPPLYTNSICKLIGIKYAPCYQSIIGQILNVRVQPIPTVIVGDTLMCMGSSVHFSSDVSGGTWSVANSSIASITASGVATTVSPGTTMISYTVAACNAITKIVYVQTTPSTILPTADIAICNGTSVSLSNATLWGNWTSSNNAIAMVNSVGMVTGVASGSATISYNTGCGSAATRLVTVNAAPDTITGDSYSFPNTVLCTTSSVTYTNRRSGGTWSNEPTTFGTIDATTGVFTSSATAGTTLISYSIGGCITTLSLDIDNRAPAEITGPNVVCAQDQITLYNIATRGYWSSSDPSIANIDAFTGTILGINNGTVTITYATGCGAPVTYLVTVNGSTPVLTADEVCEGGNLRLYCNVTARGTYRWLGPNGYVSTNQNPVLEHVTSIESGTYRLIFSATDGGCVNRMNVFGKVSPIPGLTTTAAPTHLCPGENASLNVLARPSGDMMVYPIVYNPTTLTSATTGPSSDVSMNVALPFTFNFYGVNYSRVNISTFGYINFGASYTYTIPVSFPTTRAPLATIALFWCYLTATPGQVKYATIGTAPNRKFIVNYDMLHCYRDTSRFSGQIVLYETTNVVELFVASANADAIQNVLCGIQNATGTQGITPPGQNARNYSVFAPGQGWRFAKPTYSYNWEPSSSVSNPTISSPIALMPTVTTTYSVTVRDENSYCLGKLDTVNVVVANRPRVFDVTGGGSYCTYPGIGSPIGLSSSEAGVAYQLNQRGRSLGAAIAGTGEALSFGRFTDTTVPYRVIASRLPSSCIQLMNDSAVIHSISSPTLYTITGGNACSDRGISVGLENSQPTISYQLFFNDTASGVPLTGTGSALSWGDRYLPGVYKVVATTTDGCVRMMHGTDTIFRAPTVYSFDSINVCADVPLLVRLAGSDSFCVYHLKRNDTVQQIVRGTGSPIDFLPASSVGVYSMVAVADNGCNIRMIGQDSIFETPAISLEISPTVCMPTTEAVLTYSSTRAAPNTYSMTWDTVARRDGFLPVRNSLLPSSIIIPIPSVADTFYTGTLLVHNAHCSSVEYSFSLQVFEPISLTIDPLTMPCWNNEAMVSLRAPSGTVITYTINGSSRRTVIAADTLAVIHTPAATDTIRVHVLNSSNGSCTYDVDSTLNIVPIPFKWIGVSSSNWHNPLNWSCNQLPTLHDSIDIPSGTPFSPVITDTVPVFVKDLNLEHGASVQLSNRTQLHVIGSFINSGLVSGDGMLLMDGSATQHWSGKGSVANITLSNANEVTVDTNSAPRITSMLALNIGRLVTHDSLILGADSLKVARIAPLPAEAQIIGKVWVQYFIPGGRRGYRFVSHPFDSALSLEQLQRNMDITGAGGAANGFTTTGSNAASAFRYNPWVGNSMNASDPGWRPITSLRSTADSNHLQPFYSIRLFCRGAKGEGLSYSGYTPSSNIVSLHGNPNQHQQIVRLQKGTGANQDYNMIGNPYAAPTDIGTVIYNAKQSGNVTGAAFYVWNPYLAATGQFQAIPIGISAPIPYILQSGGGFQVRATHANDSLIFQESNKASRPSSTLLKSNSCGVTLSVFDQDNHLWDSWLLQLDSNATPTLDEQWDALKAHGSDFNLYSLTSKNIRLAIDSRPYASESIIPIGIHSNYTQTFVFKFDRISIPPNTLLYLKDKLLKSSVVVERGTQYTFNVTKNANTQGDDRFELLLQTLALRDSQYPSWNIAPNPASGALQIHFDSIPQGTVSIEVLSVTGASVYQQTYDSITNSHLTVSSKQWPSGVYLIKILCNGHACSHKFVKE